MLGSSILTRRRGPVTLPPAIRRGGMSGQMVSPATTEQTAHGVSAYRRGSRLISRTVGMLPLVLVRDGIETTERLPLLDRPVPWMSRQAAIESMVQTLIDYGNYIGLWTQFDALGRPQGVIPFHPRDCAVALTDGGLLWRIGGQPYGSADVCHIRSGGPADSLLGWGVLQTSATTLATATAVGSASEYFYADGLYPGGILKVEDPDMPPEKADELRDQWMSKVRRNRPAVIPQGVEWQAVVSPNAEQAQIAQANSMSRQGIADLLDLDGDWLGVPASSMTYANIVDRYENLIRLTCMPWMAGIEAAFTEATSRPTEVKFRTKDLLRGQTADRYANYATGIGAGFLEPNEARAEEGMEPLPEPEPTPPPAPPTDPNDPNQPPPPEGQQS